MDSKYLLLSFSTFQVKVGHIGAQGAMKNAEKILDLSRRELTKDGVLAEDFDVESVIGNYFFLSTMSSITYRNSTVSCLDTFDSILDYFIKQNNVRMYYSNHIRILKGL